MSKKQSDNPFYGMAITSSILSQLVGSPLIGIFIGRFLDDYYSTKPIFLIIGFVLGLIAGIYGTIYLVRKYIGDE
ncbi:AtpZ/AtpI family protein [Aquibacillus rhizosphaerae]|uniref:AtpZ/AtpI family protein n=1 Tax=Aquibacillus rhizosphaerae TaxID=3051431 RepID=A0ABT7L3I0_9BACI|nr:AtpZ/AtpI family protein [Aquibacillus sp. LR5S19]MDL4839151.1 AtpZ/AtpI family protein [Aquibacillus sp. LR5S19]